MGGIDRGIQVAIALIVFIFCFAIIRFIKFVLGVKPQIGVRAITGTPGIILTKLWDFITGPIFAIVFAIIVSVTFLIYIIWMIIKKFAPNFPLPLKMILLKIPPFPQLERAGIFALYDGLTRSLRSNDRVINVAKTLGNFLTKSTPILLAELPGNVRPDIHAAAAEEEVVVETPQPTNQNSQFSASDKQIINDQMQQCMAENTTQITTDMSPSTAQTTRAMNMQTSIMCQFKQLQTYSNMLSHRT